MLSLGRSSWAALLVVLAAAGYRIRAATNHRQCFRNHVEGPYFLLGEVLAHGSLTAVLQVLHNPGGELQGQPEHLDRARRQLPAPRPRAPGDQSQAAVRSRDHNAPLWLANTTVPQAVLYQTATEILEPVTVNHAEADMAAMFDKHLI